MNVRRAATTLLLAAALAAAPMVASAYEADEYEVGISTTTPAPGEAFTVTVGGPVANPTITLTISSPDVPDGAISIAGTKASTKSTTNGFASFTVTLAEPGTFSLVATDADGTVLSSQQIVASDAAEDGAAEGGVAGDGSGEEGASASGSDGSGLAETGADEVLLISGAALLVLGGATALLVSRRRRSTSDRP
ncbi:peptidase [Cellulosimicrobium arenosum]|uniref:Peptidase n=1 Tax=Cellulosimicrobium arenosum TaxID=2708133 RepID=A0A927PFH1_9MICO|nr:peptidase [Cellulosimicrobium arenosum]MBD8079760.1 peptidase [Cellulosimicrobium arenosum]